MKRAVKKKLNRFERIAIAINAKCRIHGEISVPALLALIASRLKRERGHGVRQGFQFAAQLAEHPYFDEVNAKGGDSPLEVGEKIAKAIRAEGKRICR